MVLEYVVTDMIHPITDRIKYVFAPKNNLLAPKFSAPISFWHRLITYPHQIFESLKIILISFWHLIITYSHQIHISNNIVSAPNNSILAPNIILNIKHTPSEQGLSFIKCSQTSNNGSGSENIFHLQNQLSLKSILGSF